MCIDLVELVGVCRIYSSFILALELLFVIYIYCCYYIIYNEFIEFHGILRKIYYKNLKIKSNLYRCCAIQST